jgi:hypothetical protein
MVDCFSLQKGSLVLSNASSQLWNIIDEIKNLVWKWKEIAAIL